VRRRDVGVGDTRARARATIDGRRDVHVARRRGGRVDDAGDDAGDDGARARCAARRRRGRTKRGVDDVRGKRTRVDGFGGVFERNARRRGRRWRGWWRQTRRLRRRVVVARARRGGGRRETRRENDDERDRTRSRVAHTDGVSENSDERCHGRLGSVRVRRGRGYMTTKRRFARAFKAIHTTSTTQH